MWPAATGRTGVLRRQDGVFAVAIGAERGLRNSFGERLAVHAGAILLHHFAMAHVAGIRNRHAERLRFRTLHLVRAAVAERAIGRAGIAFLDGLAVHAFFVIGGLIRVAAGASRLGHAFRMGKVLMLDVAGGTSHGGMSALGDLLPLLVTGGAVGRLGPQGGRRRQQHQQEKRTRPSGFA